MKRVLSFDFGASSGRAMLAEFSGGKIEMREISEKELGLDLLRPKR